MRFFVRLFQVFDPFLLIRHKQMFPFCAHKLCDHPDISPLPAGIRQVPYPLSNACSSHTEVVFLYNMPDFPASILVSPFCTCCRTTLGTYLCRTQKQPVHQTKKAFCINSRSTFPRRGPFLCETRYHSTDFRLSAMGIPAMRRRMARWTSAAKTQVRRKAKRQDRGETRGTKYTMSTLIRLMTKR